MPKQAKVIWANGTETNQNVIHETATTFTTDDINKCKWYKAKDGILVGSMRYVRVKNRRRSFYDQATAKIIG